MPVLKNRPPKYRKHATGQALVTISGRDIYLGTHGTAASKREYKRLIGEWEANGRALPSSAKRDGYSVAELLAAYLKFAQDYFAVEAGHSNGELKSIRLAIRAVKDRYEDAEVTDFGPLALRAVRDAMVKEGWSRRYINAQVNRIRRVFKWGVEREMVRAEIWHALQAVAALKAGKCDARETAPVTTVDDSFVDAALPFLSRQVRAMVQLQRITGARPGEIVSMRGVDLTTTEPKLWEYRPADHKTKSRGHERVIYLNGTAQKILIPFLKKDVNAHLFSPAEAEAERLAEKHKARTTPLTCGNRPGTNRKRKPRRAPGDHYDVDAYRRAITRACDVADRWEHGGRVVTDDVRLVPRWHPHQIRHNTATKLRAAHGLEAAQVILGHKTLTATQIYAERNIERAKQVMMHGA